MDANWNVSWGIYSTDICNLTVVPHVDSNPPRGRPVYMYDNARSHKTKAVV